MSAVLPGGSSHSCCSAAAAAAGSWDIYRTPKGLVIVVWDNQDPWASLRTSLNVAFQMVLHAQISTTSATNKAKCLAWAKSQADYALGSS